MGVNEYLHAPASLPPGRNPLPIQYEAGWDPQK
jgi:hypothetical protein